MKNYLLALLFGIGIGAAVVYFFFPRIETKIEVQKEVETQTRTVTRRVVLPDGTRTTERVTDTIKKENERSTTETKPSEKQWKANLLMKSDIRNLVPQYGFGIERRVLGPFFVGVGGYQDGTIKANLGFEF